MRIYLQGASLFAQAKWLAADCFSNKSTYRKFGIEMEMAKSKFNELNQQNT